MAKSTRRRRWMLLAVLPVAMYLTAFATLFVTQRSFLYANAQDQIDPATTPAAEIVEQTVPSGDVDVVVWTHDAGPHAPVIVYFHGNAGVVGHRAGRFRWMMDQGWGVVGIGLRGGSGTGGSPSETAHAADARAVYDALPRLLNRPVDPTTIALYGESLGSGIAVTLASEREVGAVMLETPYAAIDDLAQEKFPFFPIKAVGAVRDPFRSIDRIAAIDAPLLIVHGTNDSLIPITHGKRLFDAAADPKWHRWIEGGGHNDLWRREAPDAVIEFMAETFPPSDA